jgi:hypothetical protein
VRVPFLAEDIKGYIHPLTFLFYFSPCSAKENGKMLKRDENVLNNAKQMGVEKKKN